MAHFAEIDDNNVVLRVLVINDSDIINPETNEQDETIGREFCSKEFGGNWIQTSYNHNLRVRYAGPGYTYDPDLDAFLEPQPYPSWVVNTTTKSWESPLGPEPSLADEQNNNGSYYFWDEDGQQWVFVDKS